MEALNADDNGFLRRMRFLRRMKDPRPGIFPEECLKPIKNPIFAERLRLSSPATPGAPHVDDK